MNFEEWLGSKGHIDGYRTDYQSAYDKGFDEGVKTQQAKIGILQIKLNGADDRAAAVLNHKNKMIDELQARVGEALIEMKNQLGDEDFYDMQRPDYDAMMYALRNIKDILKGNKDD